MKKTFGVVASVLILSMGACTTPGPRTSEAPPASLSPESLGSIVMAIGAGMEAADIVIAVERGIFAERGIEAELVPQANGASALDLVASGAADAGVASEAAGVVRRAAGASIHIVAMGASSGLNSSIVVNESIQSPTDVQGRAIGVPAGSSASDFFVRFVAHYGLDASTIEVVDADPAELVAALERGDIDGAFLVEPWPEQAMASIDGAQILQRAGDDDVHREQQYLYYGQRLVNDERLGAAVLEAIIEGNEWLSDPENLESGAEILGRAYEMDPAEALRLVKLWRWGEFTFSPQIEQNVIAAQAYLLDAGQIAGPLFDLDDYLRPELLGQADQTRVTD